MNRKVLVWLVSENIGSIMNKLTEFLVKPFLNEDILEEDL